MSASPCFQAAIASLPSAPKLLEEWSNRLPLDLKFSDFKVDPPAIQSLANSNIL
ncbi:hypothetical protein [Nostoc sp.]|uniref:hypothetical protein n=1 Tax=Nostoc sp. TaxID=1180 RepID=UPI002FF5CCCA